MDRNVYLPLVLRVCRWLRLKPHTEPACRPTEEVSAKCPLGQCRQPVTHNSAGGKKPGIGRGNHTHTHTHTHPCTHKRHLCMYIHTHTHTCAHMHAHTPGAHRYVCLYTHMHTHTHIHTPLEHTDICVCIPTYTHVCTHTCTHPELTFFVD